MSNIMQEKYSCADDELIDETSDLECDFDLTQQAVQRHGYCDDPMVGSSEHA